MPSSPKTPTKHRRFPSNIDLALASPSSHSSHSRQHSKASNHSPITPSHNHFSRSNSIGIERDVFSSGGAGAAASNGLGNLADELADAWESGGEEDEEPDMNFHDGAMGEEGEEEGEEGEDGRAEGVELTRDSGVDVTTSPMQAILKPTNLSPPLGSGRGHRRQPSDYDGSDYGDGSDLESPGIPPGLVARMDMVESLVRRGTENNGTDRDGVVMRVIEGLKDLGGQSGVEGGATRLITAHTALSTHLHHQTRLLQTLTYPLFSPLITPPSPTDIDTLLPLLHTLSTHMPRPTPLAFAALTQLHTTTAELVQGLNHLSDTLHMSRQTTTTASRRLRSARELVQELRREDEAREEAEVWLSKGRWGERLEGRECAGVCKGVLGGFEEVCEGWRRRLVAMGEGEVGVAVSV